MKFYHLLSLFALSILLNSCSKSPTELEMLIGQWNFAYKIKEDGTKDFSAPYSLVEFTYSDGFILDPDLNGNSIWFEQINDSFTWSYEDGKLAMTVDYENAEPITFVFDISALTEERMYFNTPKGNEYFLTKHE